jgi:polysaccharide chain length determinant protein (PEP-CTERM system associated)
MIFSMPDVYRASAKVSVDTNTLLGPLMRGLAANENLMSEVDLVSKALLTRPNIEAVARETDLDLNVNSRQQMEALITSIQQRLRIRAARNNIFNITFEDSNRDRARRVVAALLNTFVESSLGAQDDDADMTDRALRAEMFDHEQRLIRAEASLAQFKKENLGYMPDDGRDYYQRLQSALSDVSDTQQQIRLLEERRSELQRQIDGEEPVFGIMSVSPMQNSRGCSQQGQIAQIEAQLASLQVDFTDKHPRIVAMKESIETLQQQCIDEKLQLAESGLTPMRQPGESLEVNPVFQNLRIQLSTADVELASLRVQLDTQQAVVAQLRADVDKIGEVETAFKQLNRDYSVVQGRHQELLRRWETLQSAKRLDPVTDEVRFVTLEPPFAPTKPVGPNRVLLLGGSFVFSLGLGFGVAFALNQLGPVFYTRRSITEATGIPVLGSVSIVLGPERIASRRKEVIAWFASYGALFVLTVVTVLFQSQGASLMQSMNTGLLS